MVAASGGGTRAAIYTTALMRGLYEINALNDVVLLSGVSGGGVSLAYFAGHHRALLEGCDEAWMKYARFVGKPFIRDVLQGLGEWRIALGDRIGKLLQESFERRFCGRFTTASKLGDEEVPFGLILNASLAGTLDLSSDCYRDECSEDFVACAQEYERLTTRIGAGGRLIFTNLSFSGRLDRPISSAHPEIRFPYVIVNDPAVKLTDAAALQANFPPVFPNAAVDDVMDRERYWVTDGGAVENRGLVSLLLALRDSLEEMNDCRESEDNGRRCHKLPQAIHIVVAEASAGSSRFTQDRGAITTIAAREKLANLAIEGLMREVKRLSKNRVHLHYLAMPASFRVDGGLVRIGCSRSGWFLASRPLETLSIAGNSESTLPTPTACSTISSGGRRHRIRGMNRLIRMVPTKSMRCGNASTRTKNTRTSGTSSLVHWIANDRVARRRRVNERGSARRLRWVLRQRRAP